MIMWYLELDVLIEQVHLVSIMWVLQIGCKVLFLFGHLPCSVLKYEESVAICSEEMFKDLFIIQL